VARVAVATSTRTSSTPPAIGPYTSSSAAMVPRASGAATTDRPTAAGAAVACGGGVPRAPANECAALPPRGPYTDPKRAAHLSVACVFVAHASPMRGLRPPTRLVGVSCAGQIRHWTVQFNWASLRVHAQVADLLARSVVNVRAASSPSAAIFSLAPA
jgi:hypothetical protein